MKEYAEKEGFWTLPGRMLLSSFFLEIGTISTPLLLSYLDYPAFWQEHLSLLSTHSDEVLKQLCSVCIEC